MRTHTPRQQPSILMITHGLGLEGAPRSFIIIAKALAAVQARVTVFSHTDGPLRKELNDVGIRVIIAPNHKDTFDLPDTTTELEHYCRNNMRFLNLSSRSAWELSLKNIANIIHNSLGLTPDLVLTNTVLGFWGVALASLWNKPSLWCIHESETPFSHLSWLPQELFDILPGLLTCAKRVIFVAKATEKIFIEAGYKFNSEVIYLGLPPDMPVFSAASLDKQKARLLFGISDNMTCFLCLGSVFERKGQLDICRALALLPGAVLARVHCHIVGDRPGTPYSMRLHDCIKHLSGRVKESITIFPETLDTGVHYRAADAFVMCSRVESYPFVILEAMSLGLPIITTPVYGIKEQLTTHEALFYDPGDTYALAQHIELLSTDPQTKYNLSINTLRRYLELPSYKDVEAAYIKLVMACIKEANFH